MGAEAATEPCCVHSSDHIPLAAVHLGLPHFMGFKRIFKDEGNEKGRSGYPSNDACG
jgi:hypothetical protein